MAGCESQDSCPEFLMEVTTKTQADVKVLYSSTFNFYELIVRVKINSCELSDGWKEQKKKNNKK